MCVHVKSPMAIISGEDPNSLEVIRKLEEYRAVLVEMGIDVSKTSPQELLSLIEILEEYEADGTSATEERLLEADYWRAAPSIEEFCEDDYWLGSVLQRDDSLGQKGMFPKWREEVYKVFQPGRRVNQIIMTGAIGLGKTMVASVITLYRLALLMCLRNPIQYYGLARISRLDVGVFSVTKAQVMGGAFADIAGLIGACPFFQELIPSSARAATPQQVRFQNGVVLKAGSKLHQALGGNALVSFIDEINFRLEKDAAKAAKNLVNSLERRQESRFKQHQDNLMILVSSAKDQVDFLTQHIEKNRTNPHVAIWDFPLWDIRGGVTINYSGKRFLVDVGDNISPAAILPVADFRSRVETGELSEEESALVRTMASMPSTRFMWVPVEHRKSFDDDIESSIRDLGGRAMGRMAKFFPDVMPVINCLRDGILNPFKHHTLKLSVDSTHEVKHLLADQGRILLKSSGNSWVPKRHQHSPRYIHIDIATGGVDALGISMVHPIYMTEVKRLKLDTQDMDASMMPVYELDFALRITRESPMKEVDFSKIRVFIGWLRDHGFLIRSVSCDLRNLSQEMRSILGKMGFKTHYLSVDMKRDPYDTLKQVVVEGRFHMFPHDFLCLEMVNLEDNVKKIDHPDAFDVMWRGNTLDMKRGSKDLTDSVAGAVYMAETDVTETPLPLYNPEENTGGMGTPQLPVKNVDGRPNPFPGDLRPRDPTPIL